MDPKNQNQVTDEQVEEQIKELHGKENKTQEDNDNLEGLKTEKQTRFQKRIDKLTWESKSAQEELERERERAKDLEEKLNAKPKTVEPARVVQDTVEIGGKAWDTDDTLISKIKANQMTDDEAFKYQTARNTAQITANVTANLKKEDEDTKFKTTQRNDYDKVMKEYPHFDTRHREFNPNDPLYKEANELYQDGLKFSADGMSKAITKAKRILGMTDTKIDNSKNTSMYSPSAPEKETKQAAPLTDDQKEFAVRTYRDLKNPRTGRNYTESEAIEKHQKAQDDRRR